MKFKRIAIFSAALAAALSAGLFSACGSGYESYDDPGLYNAGSVDLSVMNIDSIEVDWRCGAVSVKNSAEAERILLSETIDQGNAEDLKLHYYIGGRVLKIKFAASGASLPKDFSKDLFVTLPAGKFLNELEIENDSGDVSVEGVSIGTVSLESGSGNVLLSNTSISKGELKTQAGQVSARNVTASELSLETVSGKAYLEGTSFTELDVETKSGQIEWHPLVNFGFTLSFRAGGGNLIDHLGLLPSGENYVYGDGFARAEVETSSGDLYLTAAD